MTRAEMTYGLARAIDELTPEQRQLAAAALVGGFAGLLAAALLLAWAELPPSPLPPDFFGPDGRPRR